MRMRAVWLCVSCGLLLAGCESIYDEIFDISGTFNSDIPECVPPPITILWTLRAKMTQRACDAWLSCCVATLSLSWEVVPAQTRLERWLRRDGFQCDRAELDDPIRRVCVSRRVSHYLRLLHATE